MTDLFLVAHKVRGEPAFDVAQQMQCPECVDANQCTATGKPFRVHGSCIECDGLGYWWIIPTSGHRAYPWWSKTIAHISREATFCYCEPGEDPFAMINPMPPSLPDHYPTRTAPTVSLIDALGLRKPKAEPSTTPIARRF